MKQVPGVSRFPVSPPSDSGSPCTMKDSPPATPLPTPLQPSWVCAGAGRRQGALCSRRPGGAGSAEWAVLGSENQAPRGTGNPGSERIGSHGEAGESRVSLAGHLLPASAGLANLLRAGEGRDGSPERASGRRCSGQRSSERPFGPRGSRRAPRGAGLRGQECWSTLQSGWVPPVSLPTWQFPQVCLAG